MDVKQACLSEISVTGYNFMTKKAITQEAALTRINQCLGLIGRKQINKFELISFCETAKQASTYNGLEQVLNEWKL